MIQSQSDWDNIFTWENQKEKPGNCRRFIGCFEINKMLASFMKQIVW